MSTIKNNLLNKISNHIYEKYFNELVSMKDRAIVLEKAIDGLINIKKGNDVCNGERCCCNCEHNIELFKHPFNRIYHGQISETTELYACTVSFDLQKKDYTGMLFERKHGICEMHKKRNPLNLEICKH